MRRWLTAPYRLIWRVLLDTAFGSQAQREQRYEAALAVFENPNELGYSLASRVPTCPVPGGSCLLCDDDHCREL